MDSKKKFEMPPFPIEKEFKIASVKQQLHQLSKEELEAFLAQALETMAKLAFQVTQLRDYIDELEGKSLIDTE